MKRLTISLKSSDQVREDFLAAYKHAKNRTAGEPHYEVSFDNRKDFDMFLRNMHILSKVSAYKPKSIYELARRSGLDMSNLNKIILFYEKLGALRIKKQIINGRTVKTPIVDYDKIEFNLAA